MPILSAIVSGRILAREQQHRNTVDILLIQEAGNDIGTKKKNYTMCSCCILRGPDEERTLDVVPRRDGARNSC